MDTKGFSYLFGNDGDTEKSEESTESTGSFEIPPIRTFYVHIVKKSKKKRYFISSKETIGVWRILMSNVVPEEVESELKELLLDELLKIYIDIGHVEFIFHDFKNDEKDWEKFVDEVTCLDIVTPLKKISKNKLGDLFIV